MNLAEISVRISSPAAKVEVEVEPVDLHPLGPAGRSHISIQCSSAFQRATWSKASTSKSASSSRLSTRSTLRLNSAVTPAVSS